MVNKITIPYDTLFQKFHQGRFIQGSVTEINERSVKLYRNNQNPDITLNFDYLIIATGSSYALPLKLAPVNSSQIHEQYDVSRQEMRIVHLFF